MHFLLILGFYKNGKTRDTKRVRNEALKANLLITQSCKIFVRKVVRVLKKCSPHEADVNWLSLTSLNKLRNLRKFTIVRLSILFFSRLARGVSRYAEQILIHQD